MSEPVAPTMRPYGRHILICANGDCANPEAAEALQRRFAELARQHGLSKLRNPQRVKCVLAGCLGVCSGGPIVVVYPEGTWYHHVDAAAFERIVLEHALGGQPVGELAFHQHGEAGNRDEEAGAFAAGTSAGVAAAPDGIADGASALAATGEPGAPAADQAEEPMPATLIGSTEAARARRVAARQANIRKGLVIVNTGNGKGKTTAALGVLLRAWGRDMRLGGVQFFKHENANFGELRALQRLNIPLRPMGDGFTWTSRDLDATRAKALHGWELARQAIASGSYDIYLLDEFTYLMSFGWLAPGEVVAWLSAHKPPLLHLIITGRDAPPELVAFADLVTEMREVKHPFREQGIRAQKGIEF